GMTGIALRLLHSFPHEMRLATGQPSRIVVLQFIGRKGADDSLSRGIELIRKRTALDLEGDSLTGLIDRVGAVVGECALGYRLVFLRRCFHSVIRGDFLKLC